MLQGVAAPQIALVTTPVLSARPQFNFGQSSLVFTPTKAYESSNKQPDNDLGDLAKALRQQQKDEQERKQQEYRDAHLKLAEKKQDESERHNRMMERIRAASDGIDGVGGGRDFGEVNDAEAMKALGVDNEPPPLSLKDTTFEFDDVAVKAGNAPPEQKKQSTSTEIPSSNAPISSISPNASQEPSYLADVELGWPEDVGEPRYEPEKDKPALAGPPSLRQALIKAPIQESKATVGNQALTLQKSATPKTQNASPFGDVKLELGGPLNQALATFADTQKKDAPNESVAPLPSNATDEARIGKALPTIALKAGEVPYSRFKNYEVAKQYLEAVKRGTPEVTAMTPKATRDSKGRVIGYEIEWKSNEEALRKQEEKLADALAKKEKLTADQAAARSKLLLSEGRAVNAQDSIRNYTKPNGFREAVQRFIPAYNNATEADKKKLANVGLSDIDLIDNYARAMGGGKITEGQAHLISQAKTLKEKMQVLYGQNFGKGEQLSQAQRDTMLENMLEAHNSQARNANNILKRVRERLIVNGVKDELFLPETYTDNLITKTKARSELTRLKDAVKSLRMDAEKVAGNKLLSQEERNKKIVKIGKMFEKYKSEIDHLSERLDDEEYSGTEILGLEDFEKAKGGFIAGDRMVAEAEKE